MPVNRTLLAATLVVASIVPAAARAQFAGTPDPATFHDTSMLKPPAGHKVAIVVFEFPGELRALR